MQLIPYLQYAYYHVFTSAFGYFSISFDFSEIACF